MSRADPFSCRQSPASQGRGAPRAQSAERGAAPQRRWLDQHAQGDKRHHRLRLDQDLLTPRHPCLRRTTKGRNGRLHLASARLHFGSSQAWQIKHKRLSMQDYQLPYRVPQAGRYLRSPRSPRPPPYDSGASWAVSKVWINMGRAGGGPGRSELTSLRLTRGRQDGEGSISGHALTACTVGVAQCPPDPRIAAVELPVQQG
jgi:hypothetical protein